MVTELVLLGFGQLHSWRNVLFPLFLMVYIVTITGNIFIIALVTSSPRLHSPMYFFLCNLSLCEIIFTTNIVPNMLNVVWREGGTMSIYGCFTQFYFYTSSGSIECLILTIMAVDRYLAISSPLRYTSVMDFRRCTQLVALAWLTGFLVMSIITFTICSLVFCGPNVIDHLFCDLSPILQIASRDTLVTEMEAMVIAVGLSIFPFMLIIGSYSSILCTILRIPSDTGRKKAFSTCSSHLASVCTYFGTLFIIYLAPPHGRSTKLNKVLSLLYIVVTPLFNPIIYSLRNQEFKACISSFIVFLKGDPSLNF